MTYNQPSGDSVEVLTQRAIHAIAREWGITETEAAEALERVKKREHRLGPEVARAQVWAMFPEPRQPVVIDLTEEVAG